MLFQSWQQIAYRALMDLSLTWVWTSSLHCLDSDLLLRRSKRLKPNLARLVFTLMSWCLVWLSFCMFEDDQQSSLLSSVLLHSHEPLNCHERTQLSTASSSFSLSRASSLMSLLSCSCIISNHYSKLHDSSIDLQSACS